jgi:arginyl-tRNA synthetase
MKPFLWYINSRLGQPIGDLGQTVEHTTHGDWDLTSKAPFYLAGHLKNKPLDNVPKIIQHLNSELEVILDRVENTGPYINIKFRDRFLIACLEELVAEDFEYPVNHQRTMIEYVSANPTGPLTLGAGRGAVYGSGLAKAMRTVGYAVWSTWYVNDSPESRQVQLFTESVRRLQAGEPLEEEHYRGAYVKDIAERHKPELAVRAQVEDQLAAADKVTDEFNQAQYIPELEGHPTLISEFLLLMSQGRLTPTKKLAKFIEQRADGSWWFMGPDMEEAMCVRRTDKSFTYFWGDILLHAWKLMTHYDQHVNVLGADHQGHVPRMRSACRVMGYAENQPEYIMLQMVSLLEHGQRQTMHKRDGNIVELGWLVDECGKDVVRWFFLNHAPNTPMVFDMDVAKDLSTKNPVFYVQYAHARACSVLEKYRVHPHPAEHFSNSLERRLCMKLFESQTVLQDAVESRQLQRITVYCTELSKLFQQFYAECEIQGDGLRLLLTTALVKVLRHMLGALEISAPEHMEKLA